MHMQDMKFFVIYADFEFLLRPVTTAAQDPQTSFAEKQLNIFLMGMPILLSVQMGRHTSLFKFIEERMQWLTSYRA